MEELIKALQIFLKYGRYEISCEHETIMIINCRYDTIADEDIKELESLGFYYRGDGWAKHIW